MTRSTAPSMWLPGFDPEPLELLVPSTEADLSIGSACETDDVEFDDDSRTVRTRPPWRVAAPAVPAAVRALWPQLNRADLANLDGAVTKFEANLAAIRTLRLIEGEDREASETERGTLLRYTGWGGLPASFNLEGDDTA